MDQMDLLHGEQVADPYRWLEDTDSPETAAWVEAQNSVTQTWLSNVPERDEIAERLRQLWDFPRYQPPIVRAGRAFDRRNTGLQNQDVLFVDDRVLLDPAALSDDGTVALTGVSVSQDGTLLAWAMSEAGSDWMTWRVRDVETGQDLADHVGWTKFTSAAWHHDGSGFFYSAPDRAGAQELLDRTGPLQCYFHALGTNQTEDVWVFSVPGLPESIPNATVSQDGRFVIVHVGWGSRPEQDVYVLDREQPDRGFQPLVTGLDTAASVITNDGSSFVVLTDLGAPTRRIVRVDLADPRRDKWVDLVAATDDNLVSALDVGGRLICHYLRHASSVLQVHDLRGAHLGSVPLGDCVSVMEMTGSRDDATLHAVVSSFAQSGAVVSYNVVSGEFAVDRQAGRVFDDLVTTQVFVASEDGTKVPVFLVHRADIEPTGDVPTLLYGYGGFNIPTSPSFSVARALWVERGGLAAYACLRGGGEYGKDWYDAGRLANKQNVFDDFCAVAEWLSASGWSNPARVAINGGSNGGLLVGAWLNQRPELFGAAVPEVGVMDLLRFHLFTIGWAWKSDFGDPEDPEQYAWLRAYSRYHRVGSNRNYPPTLVTTGDHDDRVVPGHSYKYAAALQFAQPQGPPLLLRVDTAAGHGAGKPVGKMIAEKADLLAFLHATVGTPPNSRP